MSTLFNSPVGNITARPPELGEEVFLHPVVALMIADHHTTATTVTHTHKTGDVRGGVKNNISDPTTTSSNHRERVYDGCGDVQAIGILMGHRRRKSLEISSAFELIFSLEDGNSRNKNNAGGHSSPFDEEIAIQRRDLAKGLYNTLEVVGWYAIVDKNNKRGGGGSAMSESFFESVNESVKALFEMDAPIVAVADFSTTTKSNANNNNNNSDNLKFPLSLFETPSEEFVHKYLASLPGAGGGSGSGGGSSSTSASTSTKAAAKIPTEMKARKITFSFTASESERIATDLLLRLEGVGGGGATATTSSSSAASTSRNNNSNDNKSATTSSSVEQHAHRLQTSSVLLGKAIDTIIAYLDGVLAYYKPTTASTTTDDRGNKKGVVPISDPDPDLLRLIMGIVQALPCGTAYTNGSSPSSSSFVAGANNGGNCANNDGKSSITSSINAGRHGPSDRDFIENLLVAYVSVVQKSASKIEPLLKSTNGVVWQQRREEEEKARKASSARNNGPDSLI